MQPLNRRGFLRTAGLAGAAWLTPIAHVLHRAAEEPGKPRDHAQSIIMLWLQGGPSQLETFDPHPDTRIAAGTKAIDTAVKGRIAPRDRCGRDGRRVFMCLFLRKTPMPSRHSSDRA